MKKLYFIVICFLFVSCRQSFFDYKLYDYQEEELIPTWYRISQYKYFLHDGWYSPLEFEKYGGGCCRDFASTLMYYLGPKSSFVIIAIEGNPNKKHALVFYEGRYIEPQIYGLYYNESDITIETIINFNDTMEYCTDNGSKSCFIEVD